LPEHRNLVIAILRERRIMVAYLDRQFLIDGDDGSS
jgi:hypothetical protein